MCLIFLALKKHPDYKLIIAANRDEFYRRKTAPAGYWPERADILGGRDLEAGGTWLAVNTNGRISMVTNFRDLKNLKAVAPSRGHLVTNYLVSGASPEAYLKSVVPSASEYNGFNLLTGDQKEFFYYSNCREGITRLTEGLYGLSNHLLDTPWPKVNRGKERVSQLLKRASLSPDDLFDVLFDDAIAPDALLPDTGVGMERERALSAMFIKSPGYGTRCSTVVMVDQSDHVTFVERVYDTGTFDYTSNRFEFQIQ